MEKSKLRFSMRRAFRRFLTPPIARWRPAPDSALASSSRPFLELKNVGETTLEVTEKKTAQHEHSHRIRRQHRKLLPMRPRRRHHTIAIRPHDPPQRIQRD